MRNLFTVLGAGMLACLSAPATAALIEVTFESQVPSADPVATANGPISVGDAVTGRFVYDNSIAALIDSSYPDSRALFEDALLAFEVSIGGNDFALTAPNDMRIWNLGTIYIVQFGITGSNSANVSGPDEVSVGPPNGDFSNPLRSILLELQGLGDYPGSIFTLPGEDLIEQLFITAMTERPDSSVGYVDYGLRGNGVVDFLDFAGPLTFSASTLEPTAAPLPAAAPIFMAGLAGLGAALRRRRSRRRSATDCLAN